MVIAIIQIVIINHQSPLAYVTIDRSFLWARGQAGYVEPRPTRPLHVVLAAPHGSTATLVSCGVCGIALDANRSSHRLRRAAPRWSALSVGGGRGSADEYVGAPILLLLLPPWDSEDHTRHGWFFRRRVSSLPC